MTRMRGLAAFFGMALVFVLGVACGDGEASVSPAPVSVAAPAGPADVTVPPPGVQAPLRGLSEQPAAAGATLAGGPAPGYSLTLQTGGGQAGIRVTGQGKITLEPDLALLNIGVETVATTVAQARDDAASAMAAVVLALGARNIEAKDIQTRFFNISPQYEFQEVTRKQVVVGYRVTNSAAVKIRDLDALGPIIDQVATAAGDAIRINGIRFTVEDPKPFHLRLREQAVKDALAKAEQFARLTGVSLGRLVFISESTTGPPVVREFAVERAFAVAAAAPDTPVSGGELELRMTVQAVFDIQ